MRTGDRLNRLRHREDPGAALRAFNRLSALVPGLGTHLATARRDRLAELSTRSTVYDGEELRVLAEAELADSGRLPPATVALIRRMGLESHRDRTRGGGLRGLAGRLTDPVLNPGEPWADLALAQLPALDDAFVPLLAHAATASAGRPTAAWDRRARLLLAALDEQALREAVVSWLALAGRPRTVPWPVHGDTADPYNADALRGLAWTLSLASPHPEIPRALGALLETSLRRVPGSGPRSPRVANSCVLALSRTGDASATAELARLAGRVTYRPTRRLIDAALGATAAALGTTSDDLGELTVPTYGLTETGHAVTRVGEHTAQLRIDGRRAVLSWRRADGTAVRSVPAAVRRDHAGALKDLTGRARAATRTLAAQSERLDRLFLSHRTWPYALWRERYLDHPLVGTLARRLLWTAGGTACCWTDGALRTLDGAAFTPDAGAGVALWHPAGAGPGEVAAWRARLEEHGVTQPFKQAHREVYPLTDAERAAGTHSDRFAGHVLRQGPFHALAAARGWSDRLRMYRDDEVPPPVRELPRWGLRAEFLVACDTGDEAGRPELTGSGAYAHLLTGRVRFHAAGAPSAWARSGSGVHEMWDPDGGGRVHVDPLPLESVPPLVLSEVLRDVDLFVGVAGLGSDPAASGGGPGGRHAGYWRDSGFGELGPAAELRRDLLARLLPRLAIGDRCELRGRFLHVTGTRHVYRIHLGSGNVLIAPHDRYLCVVPRRPAAVPGYLPFEGDHMLSVLLSKAILLAGDDRITDPSILSQL